MFRLEVSAGWQSPIIPDKDDWGGSKDLIEQNFRNWLINANFDSGGRTTLLGIRLLGLYLTLFVDNFWQGPSE